jgi:hypothetical protein
MWPVAGGRGAKRAFKSPAGAGYVRPDRTAAAAADGGAAGDADALKRRRRDGGGDQQQQQAPKEAAAGPRRGGVGLAEYFGVEEPGAVGEDDAADGAAARAMGVGPHNAAAFAFEPSETPEPYR